MDVEVTIGEVIVTAILAIAMPGQQPASGVRPPGSGLRPSLG